MRLRASLAISAHLQILTELNFYYLVRFIWKALDAPAVTSWSNVALHFLSESCCSKLGKAAT
jgi:hypothetical protein